MTEELTPAAAAFPALKGICPTPSYKRPRAKHKACGIRIGLHTSIAKGLSVALTRADDISANALQIFSASPRMWQLGPDRIPEAEAADFRRRRAELGLYPLLIHANYLINLASPHAAMRARSIAAFRQEIARALKLGANFLVVHPGSALSEEPSDHELALSRVAESMEQAGHGVELGGLRILLENAAGQGNCVGAHFRDLNLIIERCPDLPLGVCLDTAHLFASGWDIRISCGLDEALQHIEHAVGLNRVFVVHMNDSKADLGSRVDRHEQIGRGKIGMPAFRCLLNHPRLAGKPFILETPVVKPDDDARNVAILWRLARSGGQ
jgi:deoxyribonuclease IV